MKFLWLIILISISSYAQFEVIPVEQTQAVRPGDSANALIQAKDESLVTKFTPSEIQLAGDTETFLLYSIGPWVKTKDGWGLSGKVVFGKSFSPDKVYSFANNLGSIQFRGWMWNPNPDSIPPEFSYEDIPLFSRSWWIKNWPITLSLSFIILAILGRVVYLLLRARKIALETKSRKEQFKREILQAQDIRDFAMLWFKRDEMKKVFSSHEMSLCGFFEELNRYQFKPHVNETELAQINLAKEKLLTELSEEKHGV